MLNVCVTYSLPGVSRGPNFKSADLKALASRLRSALAEVGFEVGDMFGSDIDLWGFTVAFGSFEVLVDVGRLDGSTDDNWSSELMIRDPGWFRSTREARLNELKTLEWAVHNALNDDLQAREIEWHLGKGRLRLGQGQPTP